MDMPVNIQEYFPASAQVIYYKKASGQDYARYTFQPEPTPIDSLYYGYMNLNTAGHTYMWRKEYWKGTPAKWCTETYAVLRFGDDLSIKETGDWLPSKTLCSPDTFLGYRKPDGSNTGLTWAPAGGLSTTAAIDEMDVIRQNYNGAAATNSGYDAYNKTGIVEVLETFTPAYGRCADGTWQAGCGQTYSNVVHLVMYHGTRPTVPAPVRCIGAISANGVYYQSFKDYDTYAIELWLAPGQGIVQENTKFIEKGSNWGMQNCTGDLFQYPGMWMSYIDKASS